MIKNRICEGIERQEAALSSGVTSQNVMVTHARMVGWGSNGVMFLHLVPYPSALMYSMPHKFNIPDQCH